MRRQASATSTPYDILLLLSFLLFLLLFVPLCTALKIPFFRPKDHNTTSNKEDIVPPPLKFNVQCQCGKVKAAVQCLETAAPPVRLVCYCKDCRGYYSALNHMAKTSSATLKHQHEPPAKLDAWGGVDWLCLYPRDITITQGKDLLVTTKIRDSSPVRQVYSSCCYTPMFRFGEMAVLMNTNTIISSPKENTAKPDIRFRIMGRQSLEGDSASAEKPKMSWSIPPLSWLWVMGGRINRDLMTPMPLDLAPKEDVPVMKGFKEEG